MKSIVEYINEGIFGDNIKSAIKINGVEIYEPEWKQCEEYFKKRRDKYFQKSGLDKDKVYLGDLQTEHTILYNEKDCIICLDTEETDHVELYILCPETIYMNHLTDECTQDKWKFSLTNIDDANDYSIAFIYYSDVNNWAWLEGCSTHRGLKKASEEVGITKGYLPVTISDKAQNIIKKYMKR